MRWLDSVIDAMNRNLDILQEKVEESRVGVLWSMGFGRGGHSELILCYFFKSYKCRCNFNGC